MPELPEVESTARFLNERVAGAKISSVDVRWARTVSTHRPGDFRASLVGRKISRVRRRGKFVLFELDPGPEVLLAHMRMSGSFDVLSAKAERDNHDRLIWGLSTGKEIRFCDPRKFGRVYLVKNSDDVLGRLGVEPLSAAFTPDILASILRDQRARVKPFLLRQDRIAGLGNIYVDEALWFAKVHPLRAAGSLRSVEIQTLHLGIQQILREAIDKSGTDFGDGVVYGGGYEPLVYGRDGEPCRRCKHVVTRIVVAQRGTHICSQCQRRPRRI